MGKGKIMKKFNLVKTSVDGQCDAVRCKEPTTIICGNGMQFCEHHFAKLTKEEKAEVGQEEQEIKASTQQDTIEEPFVEVLPAEDAQEDLQAEDLSPEDIAEAERVDAIAQRKAVAEIEIWDQESLDMFGALLKEAKGRLKKLKKLQSEYSKPAYDAHKKILSLFKPGIKELEKFEALVKGKITEYVEQQREERARLMTTPVHAMPYDGQRFELPEVPELPEGISEKQLWTIELEDIEQVPIRYLVLDNKAIEAEIKSKGGENVNIPGIRIFQRSSLSVRS
jgi:hypothetical protein